MSLDAQEYRELARIAERAVRFARKAGAGTADAFVESVNEFRADVHAGRLETLKQADRRGLGLRAIVDRRVAIVYTSDFRETSLADLAARAVALARQSTPDEFADLPPGPLAQAHAEGPLALYDDEVVGLTAAQKIDMALEMEKTTLAYDKRIARTDGCTVQTTEGSAHLASSRGGVLSFRGTGMGLFVNPLADDAGGRQQSGGYGSFGRSLAAVETPEQVAREAGRRAVSRIGARPVPTQKAPVILHPDIAAAWLGNFFDAFSGDNVFKNTSYLADKLGAAIAASLVTVIDDGTLPGGVATAPFDGDGLPTRRNVLIDQGVCRMFVYDAYWARKAKAESTGNAVRGYTDVPAIGNRNLYIANGTSPPEEIRKGVDKGFYMVDQGAFGYNPTTGDYSYQAAGFWIEGGEIAHPVQEITVASTTLDMLKNVVKVGNDLRFNGTVNSPTLLISEMTISGAGPAGS
jgi:PmbA protein